MATRFGVIQLRVLNKPNQINSFILLAAKRVTSLLRSSPRHCTRAAQLLLKKCRSSYTLLSAQDLNLRTPAPETNAFPLDQLAGISQKI